VAFNAADAVARHAVRFGGLSVMPAAGGHGKQVLPHLAQSQDDSIVPSVPSTYPPAVSRGWWSARPRLLHVPAWRLLIPAGALTLSFAVVGVYLLWR